jgi:hypothetical protein
LFDIRTKGYTYATSLASSLKGNLQFLEAEILYYKFASEFGGFPFSAPIVIVCGNNVGVKMLLLHNV